MRTRRRKYAVRKASRRRVRRNPARTKGAFTGVLINGAITAASAVGATLVSAAVVKMVKGSDSGRQIDKNKWNNGVLLGLSLVSAFLAPRFVDQDRAEAITGGIMTAAAFAVMKTAFGFDPTNLAGFGFSNAAKVDMLLTPRPSASVPLLGAGIGTFSDPINQEEFFLSDIQL